MKHIWRADECIVSFGKCFSDADGDNKMVDTTFVSPRRLKRKRKKGNRLVFFPLIVTLFLAKDYRRWVTKDATNFLQFGMLAYARSEQPPKRYIPESKHSLPTAAFEDAANDPVSSNKISLSYRLRSPNRILLSTKRTSQFFGNMRRDFFSNGVDRRRIIFAGSGRQNWKIPTQLMGGADSTNIDISIQQEDSSIDALPDSSRQRSSADVFLQSAFPIGLKDSIKQKAFQSLTIARQICSRVGPSFLTILSLVGYNSDTNGVSFFTLYAMSLLGASCGFHVFLYFITLGYALGVTLPLVAALFVYHKQKVLPGATIFHSSMTILWGFRLFSFLTLREYVTWPALHQKVIQVQAKMKIPFASKLLCWFAYSFFYVALMSSCWSRLAQEPMTGSSGWGFLGCCGLSLQVVGLSLESVADLQKNGFKSRHRHSWCNVGVWKSSTHPNYLGEGLFWWGTYLAHGFHSLPLTLLATIGVGFIMMVLKGAARSLSSKQKEKYGQEADFYEFQRTHNVFGPKHWWWWLYGMEELSRPVTLPVAVTPSSSGTPEISGPTFEEGSAQAISTDGGCDEVPSP